MLVAASVCLLGMKWPVALIAGAVGTLAAASYLSFSKPSRERRGEAQNLLEQLKQIQAQLVKAGQVILGKHNQRKKQFDNSVEELKQAYEHYQAEESSLHDVLTVQRKTQYFKYLSGYLLQDYVGQIRSLNSSMLSILNSYGIESAADIDNLKLMGIPMLSPSVTLDLMTWREQVQKGFKFKPEHGVSFEDAKQAGEAALRRFKIAQARKVLMGATQLESMAEVGLAETNRDLKKFNELAERARRAAILHCGYQTNRRLLERWLNKNAFVAPALAVIVPLVAWVLWKVFG
jgi:DNA-binding helix-hairpin-helix protein with protein kinase domain